MSEMKKEFDRSAEVAAQMTLDLMEMVKGLKKKQMERVFMSVMEYPTPNTRELISQEEVDIAQFAIGLKEMQMKMAMLNLAMEEESRMEKANEQ